MAAIISGFEFFFFCKEKILNDFSQWVLKIFTWFFCANESWETIFEGGYLKIGVSWDLFSKQNIFMTKRDMKNPMLGSCRGWLGLSFYYKVWSTLVDQTCENFCWR